MEGSWGQPQYRGISITIKQTSFCDMHNFHFFRTCLAHRRRISLPSCWTWDAEYNNIVSINPQSRNELITIKQQKTRRYRLHTTNALLICSILILRLISTAGNCAFVSYQTAHIVSHRSSFFFQFKMLLISTLVLSFVESVELSASKTDDTCGGHLNQEHGFARADKLD